jgi:hypothetical protein
MRRKCLKLNLSDLASLQPKKNIDDQIFGK